MRNWAQVLSGRKTWVGYWEITSDTVKGLPPLRESVIHPGLGYSATQISPTDIRKLNYLYAKHYSISDDLGILVRNIRSLGI